MLRCSRRTTAPVNGALSRRPSANCRAATGFAGLPGVGTKPSAAASGAPARSSASAIATGAPHESCPAARLRNSPADSLLNDDGRRRSFEQIASRGLRLRSRRSRNRLSSLNGRAEHIRPSLEAESISSAKPRRTTVALVGSVYWGSSSRSTELTAGDGTRFGPTLARMRACGSRESRLRARGGENSPAGLRARVSAGCPKWDGRPLPAASGRA